MVLAIYVGALIVLSELRSGDFTLLAQATHHNLEPGGAYQSLRRFREAEAFGPVDVVFLGSSHAYRGFDPRRFEVDGQRAFNLGSTNQTPLNARYIWARYAPVLRPRLVIVELYPHNLSHDGLESMRDLAVNTTFHPSLLKVAVSTRQLGAVNYVTSRGLGLGPDLDAVSQREIEGETYIEGGYCETLESRHRLLTTNERLNVSLSAEQLDHLLALTIAIRKTGARVLWVTHPLPEDHLDRIVGLPALRQTLQAAADEAGAAYWDYNERLVLDPLEMFVDFHHLNQAGVERFNDALLIDLEQQGLWPP